MKIALVHPWLTNMGGAERLLLELHNLYPNAPIYTSVYDPANMPEFAKLDVRTTYLQKLPFWRFKQQVWSPLRPGAFKRLDLSEFDVVISVDTAEAKNVRVRPGALHICYCNTPIRYYWSHYEEYKNDPGFGALNPLIRLIMPPVTALLKRIDYRAAQRVDYFISNSSEIERRVQTYYNRPSAVINPPVSTASMQPSKLGKPRSGFVIASRQTTYKRVDLAIAACSLINAPLTVIGDGTEHEKLKAMAGPTIRLLGRVDEGTKIAELHKAAAFIFPTEEDFGIAPIEAIAAGCPVVAYAKGGVVDWMIEGKTGLTFDEQTPEALAEVLRQFKPEDYDEEFLIKHAEKFRPERFRDEIKAFVDQAWSEHQKKTD